ncbi:MAG: AMP-binding protein [Gammaproteobacteria bacterium]|nr:AMP-binding protein [Gammaproteobacteria bacterium]
MNSYQTVTGLPLPFSHLDVAGSTDDIALVYAGHELSYGALFREVWGVVCHLTGQGVQPGDLLALQSSSYMLSARMVYAARFLGLTLLPLDPAMARERRNRLLSEVGCILLVTDSELLGLPAGVRVISAASFVETAETVTAVEMTTAQEADAIQLIIATSGTEGRPKGVMLSGVNLAASSRAVRQRLGLGPSDLWLCCLPLFHIGGLSILYRCMNAGAGVVLHQGFDAPEVWSDLRRHRVTHISLVPAMLAQLLDVAQTQSPPESLGVVLVGGGPLEPGLAARAHAMGWPLSVSYGMSETSSLCISQDGVTAGMVSGEVGLPLEGFELAISERGRIMLRGPAVMQGYANPARSPGQGLLDGGWFETGDLGEQDGSGRLRVLGRADDLLISGGRNIHPQEVEEWLASCPGVGAVAVTGQVDERWGEVLVVLYTGRVSSGQLQEWCRNNIPSPLRPRRFVQVPGLPLNAMGKLDRRGLLSLVGQG